MINQHAASAPSAVLAADHLAVADPNASLQLALLHQRLEVQQDEADGQALWGGQISESKESTLGSQYSLEILNRDDAAMLPCCGAAMLP